MTFNQVVPLPPLAEQHRIVAKVDELMELCDRLQSAQQNRESQRDRLVAASLHHLNQSKEGEFGDRARFYFNHLSRLTVRSEHIKELRQTILNLAVRGKLVPQDPNDEPASELLKRLDIEKQQLLKKGKIKKSKLLPEIMQEDLPCKIPEKWQWSNIQSISLKVTDGEHITPQRSKSGYYLLSARNVTNEGIKLENVDYVPRQEYERIRKRCDPEIGDILISCSGSVGRIAIVNANEYVMVRSVALIKYNQEFLDSSFFANTLRSPIVQCQIVNKSKTTAQSNLFLGKINEILVPLPPLAEQRRIVAKVDELMGLCDQLETQLTTTQTTSRQLLESLLHQALTPST